MRLSDKQRLLVGKYYGQDREALLRLEKSRPGRDGLTDKQRRRAELYLLYGLSVASVARVEKRSDVAIGLSLREVWAKWNQGEDW